jgi:hypothetical protein
LGLIVHNQMENMLRVIISVHNPCISFQHHWWVKVHALCPRMYTKNNLTYTELPIINKLTKFFMQINKGFERSMMDENPNKRIVIPTSNHSSGDHDKRFTRYPWLYLCLLIIIIGMCMKMSTTNTWCIVHILSCEIINHGPTDKRRSIVVLDTPPNSLID